ncbi:hypothetical protein AAG906_034993 [Vitis piasezkii]
MLNQRTLPSTAWYRSLVFLFYSFSYYNQANLLEYVIEAMKSGVVDAFCVFEQIELQVAKHVIYSHYDYSKAGTLQRFDSSPHWHNPLCILSSFPPSRMKLSLVNDITASIKECIIKPLLPKKAKYFGTIENFGFLKIRLQSLMQHCGCNPNAVRKSKENLLILWSLPVYSFQTHKSNVLLIRVGPFVFEVGSVTRGNTNLLPKENIPKVASEADEMVQIIGELNVAGNALFQSDSRENAHHALKNSWMLLANSPWTGTQVELTHVIGLMSFLCGSCNDIIVDSCSRLIALKELSLIVIVMKVTNGRQYSTGPSKRACDFDIFDIYCSPYNRDPSSVDHPTSLVHSPTTKLCHFGTKGFGTCDDDDQTLV